MNELFERNVFGFQVDVDRKILEEFSQRARPLLCDYIRRRNTPLKIEIFKGSIDTPDANLKDIDAVIGIEM